jgi:uncharacterized membrane protein (UPF0127 family)
MSKLLRIDNLSKHTVLAERGELANTPWRRMKGLLGRDGLAAGEGLVLQPCQSVHTWFMRFPIDVLHVDRQGIVRRIVHGLPPNRLGPIVWRGRLVIELPAGVAARTSTEVGDQLALG